MQSERDRSLSVNEDAELIERYLGGEKYAASLLVARHSNALFCWLRWKTGSREDAEDLTQLVWVRAFPALPRLEDRRAVRAWLFAIMRREFAHWLRDHKTHCSLEALGRRLTVLPQRVLPMPCAERKTELPCKTRWRSCRKSIATPLCCATCRSLPRRKWR